jgi:hypothetical protein
MLHFPYVYCWLCVGANGSVTVQHLYVYVLFVVSLLLSANLTFFVNDV